MVELRPFEPRDIDDVSALHRRVWPRDRPEPPAILASYREWLRNVYLDHPWQNTGVNALVAEVDGEILGFLGAVPRPLEFEGRALTAAVSSQFVVSPDRRATLAGFTLIREFLGGPQDISIADEANDDARRLWEASGGATAAVSSAGWTAVLRPTSYIADRLSEKSRLRWLRFLRPVATISDTGVNRIWTPAKKTGGSSGWTAGDLGAEDLLAWFGDAGSAHLLRPRYDRDGLNWLLRRIGSEGDRLRMRAVRDAKGHTQGCFVYRIQANGLGAVVLLQARKRQLPMTFDWLVRDAMAEGLTGLSGRLSTDLIGPVASARALYLNPPQWNLFHSSSAAIAAQLRNGTALVSKLEGEYPSRLSYP